MPPISAMTRLTWRWPRGVAAASATMDRPTARDPVKAITATSGCSTSRAPTTSPTPGRNCTTPRGAPAATSASTRRDATSGVCSAGLRMTGFPATRAATVMPVGMASGKFHGAITAVTPLPW